MSDCGVCIGGGDYDMPAFCSESYLKARKPHKCCECYREIPKGAEYERVTGKWDRVSTYKTCMDCVNIRRGLSCGSWCYTMLWEDIREIFSSVNISCLDKIKTPSAKAYFLDQWHKWKFEE